MLHAAVDFYFRLPGIVVSAVLLAVIGRPDPGRTECADRLEDAALGRSIALPGVAFLLWVQIRSLLPE
jgi:hypothetical protein